MAEGEEPEGEEDGEGEVAKCSSVRYFITFRKECGVFLSRQIDAMGRFLHQLCPFLRL